MDWAEWLKDHLATVLGGLLGGGLVSILNARAQREKIRSESDKLDAEQQAAIAEAINVVSATALSMIGPLREQLHVAAQDYRQAREQIDALDNECGAMRDRLMEAHETIRDLERSLATARKKIEALEEQRDELQALVEEYERKMCAGR